LALAVPGTSAIHSEAILEAIRHERIGGNFWAKPVKLERSHDLVLVPDDLAQFELMRAGLPEPGITVVLPPGMNGPPGCPILHEPFDPWHLAAQAREVWAGSNRELATVAALLGKPVRLFDASLALRQQPDLLRDLVVQLSKQAYASPFDGAPWTVDQVVDQLGQWRRLIESNRPCSAVYGVARWKRVTVDNLLWDGTGPVRHARSVSADLGPTSLAVVWKSRTNAKVLAQLEASGAKLAEIEDGFIRSVGLGANCVPPLSIITDRSGIYFDPNQASDLERLLQLDELPDAWVERSKALQTSLVQSRITKYGHGETSISMPTNKRRVLVTGQVEDDRSVLSGGGNCTNLELVARARALEPDAWIVYRPHPDVEAGHRKGHVPDADVLRHADAIERDAPIASLIDAVDALHVITSLAGFEGLLRGKAVTTHGQPFYAGWGLTNDRGAPNPRRTRRRSLGELVAATLIGYPRYVDPVTRLPCPPEVLVARIVAGQARVSSPLIVLREWQGRLKLAWQRLSGARK
jgi:capsular polysaccharide export protein